MMAILHIYCMVRRLDICLFSFPAFTVSVPTDMAIGLTVFLVARDQSSGTNKMQPGIRVGGSNYYPDYYELKCQLVMAPSAIPGRGTPERVIVDARPDKRRRV